MWMPIGTNNRPSTCGASRPRRRDVIGACGAPLHDAGFHIVTDVKNLTTEEQSLVGNQIPPSPVAGDFLISAGRFYVDGILCENEQIGLYSKQLDLPSPPEIRKLLADVKAKIGIVYLDVWQQHVTALDDPMIREKALGGPDTATRLKTIWQVKVLPVSPAAGSVPACDTTFDVWDKLIAPSTGKLNARTQPPDPTERACLLPPSAGYQRLENQLYRVEIHRGTADGHPTFVWSRDNGTVVTAIKSFAGSNVVVGDVGPDDVLGFAIGQWVEITDDHDELNGRRGQLLQIAQVEEGTRTITMTTTVPTVDLGAHPKLRRWDHLGDANAENAVAITGDWQALEDGIEVQLDKGKVTNRTGDYWLIPARTATGEIEWPPYEIPNTNPTARAPAGIRHHYCRLALAQSDGTNLTIIQDCRKIFPPFTELNIEQCCVVTIRPGPDWKSVLNNLNAQSSKAGSKIVSAHVCFQVGEYETDEPIKLTGFYSLKITGAGPGTRITVPKSEAAFIFTGCTSVEVSDLYGETRGTGFGKNSPLQQLLGVLTFLQCDSVTVESVVLKGVDWKQSSGATRSASCICIEPDSSRPDAKTSSVRIRHCDLTVGYFQVGMLIVNGDRVQIEDNVVSVNPTVAKFNLGKLLENRQIRSNISRLLVSKPTVQTAPAPKPKARAKAAALPQPTSPPVTNAIGLATVKIGSENLAFHTPQALVKVWPQLLTSKSLTPRLNESPTAHLSRIADRVLLDPKLRRANSALNKWFKDLGAAIAAAPTPASQGIVIGGQSATEIRIRDNTVLGATQGIHVGLSHRDSHKKGTTHKKGTPDTAVSLSITGNSVHVYASALLRDREGIYVGNCDTLVIEANRLSVTPSVSGNERAIDGIRLLGMLGALGVIRHNTVQGFSAPGIHPPKSDPKILLVVDNFIA